MNISIIICYIIIILELLSAVWCLYRAIKYKIFHIANKENENIKTDKEDSNIIIVIPCLREQDIIIQTIKHFLEITNDFNTVKLLIVTTQKEEYERKKSLYLEKQFIEDIKNNIDIHKLISKYNKLLSTNEIKDILSDRNKENIEDIIHKRISYSKSTNEVVREFINKNHLEKQVYLFHYPNNEGIMADQLNYVLNNFNFIDEEKYYFSVYNADSIPSKETIKDIIDTINKNNYP